MEEHRKSDTSLSLHHDCTCTRHLIKCIMQNYSFVRFIFALLIVQIETMPINLLDPPQTDMRNN